MIRREVLQQRTVIAATAAEWDAKVNAALRELMADTKKAPTIERSMEGGQHVAIIEYYVVVEKPENAADRAHLRGEYHTCDECPHLVKVDDKRVKNLMCDNGQRVIACKCDDACPWFYERLEGARK